jgi:hypothetical protein
MSTGTGLKRHGGRKGREGARREERPCPCHGMNDRRVAVGAAGAASAARVGVGHERGCLRAKGGCLCLLKRTDGAEADAKGSLHVQACEGWNGGVEMCESENPS